VPGKTSLEGKTLFVQFHNLWQENPLVQWHIDLGWDQRGGTALEAPYTTITMLHTLHIVVVDTVVVLRAAARLQ
jgi:broad-specificity NMP kinase